MADSLDFRNFGIETPVTIECGADASLTLTVRNVLDLIAPGAPPAEALRFLLTCQAARLNPFLGEIDLVLWGKRNPRWQVVISKYGYLKRGQLHPDYDGFESGVVISRTVRKEGRDVLVMQDEPGTIVPRGWTLEGGWCKVHVKGRKVPVYKRVSMTEYDSGMNVWESKPATMIEKVAIAQGHRDALAIGDGYEETELGGHVSRQLKPEEVKEKLRNSMRFEADGRIHPVPAREFEPPPSVEVPNWLPEIDGPNAWVTVLKELWDSVGASPEDRSQMLARRGVSRVEDLSTDAARELIERLREFSTANWAEKAASGVKPEEVILPGVLRGLAAPEDPVPERKEGKDADAAVNGKVEVAGSEG